MQRNNDDRFFGAIIGIWFLMLLFGLAVWGVIIWAIITLVTHFT